MTIRERAKAMLVEDEGLRTKPYDDATGKEVALPTGGKVTIGVGRNLSDVGIHIKHIWAMLEEDIDRAEKIARDIFPDYDTYTENRQLALINMIFNMGKGDENHGFMSFRNTIRSIREGDWKAAQENIRASKWARQVGAKRSQRVLKLLAS